MLQKIISKYLNYKTYDTQNNDWATMGNCLDKNNHIYAVNHIDTTILK